jgi:hypothetical protein
MNETICARKRQEQEDIETAYRIVVKKKDECENEGND